MKTDNSRLVIGPSNPVPGVIVSRNATGHLKNKTLIQINGEEIQVVWNDLKVIDLLGTGSFGEVFSMTLKSNPSLVFAVKELHLTQRTQQQNIIRESEFGSRIIDCPYAVRTFGFLKHAATVRILMEVMDCSIARVCDMVTNVPEDNIIYIANCVIRGLDTLSEVYRIHHRDVKPSNILASRTGDVKICDYGVSADIQDKVTLTADVGTYIYQAPERHDLPSNIQGYDIKSDVWSLGLTLYKIITDGFPFPVKVTHLEYSAMIQTCSDIQLPANAKCSSQGLRELVAHCLRKDKDARLNYKELLELDVFTELVLEDEKKRFAEFICNLPLN